jgi:hypothetical protein
MTELINTSDHVWGIKNCCEDKNVIREKNV